MKTIFLLPFTLLLPGVSLLSPSSPERGTTSGDAPLCHGISNEMALLAASPAFQQLHENPLPYTHITASGEMVSFPTDDGATARGFLLKAKKPSDKWLLVYQEWWGLNDHIKREAERIYNDLDNVNVLAVDMYDGQVTDKREEAARLVQSVKRERLGSIMKGAIAYAGPRAQIASIGWCFGGSMSLNSALLGGKQAVGCVIYYGRPELDSERLKALQTDVLGIFGSKDKGIPPATVSQFEEAMKKAGETVTVKMYEADHAFANPSNPAYDKEAAADAYRVSLDYLKKRLKA